MGKIKLTLIVILVGYISLLAYKQIVGKINASNFSQLSVGMEKAEVLGFMGSPNSKNKGRSVGADSIFFYQPPFASSSGLEIEFDSLERVINLFDDN